MHLNIAQWNSEGLQKKKPELQKFLHDNKIDVICIQETMTKDNQKIFIRGFEAFRRDRKDRHKGGIITFVRNTIPAVEVQHFDTEELEHQTVKLLLPGGDMHVTNCYSPPSTPLGLHHVNIHSTRHLVVGDFNSHSPSWGYATMDTRGEDLEDWMMEKQLTLINQPDDKPTCYSRAWKTLSTPDVAMATDDIHRITTRTVQTQLGGSDHLPVILNISTEGCRTHSMRPSWNLKRANWEHFSHKTDTLTNAVEESADLNKNVKLFTTAILQAAKETIPRGKRKDYIPHWSKEVDTLHTKLSKARETMEQNPTPENTQAHNQLKEAFNQLKTKETRNTWQEKTANLNMETDSRKLWNLVSTLNEEKKREHIQTVLEENGTHYAGRQAANILADSYQEESRNTIPQQRIRDVKQEKKELLRNENTNPTMMSPLTEMELNAAIAKLKTKKAPGKDGILSDMLKHLGPRATQKLLLILNQSWTTGKCPDSWREAVIVPVLKKQKDKTKKTSYRPISLLSCLGKLMERIVNARLLKHLEENNLLNNTQSAFRKNRSTEDQLVFLAQEIENAYQKRKKTLAVFIDLTKAFDKVWRDGLLLKLLRKHVGGRMFSWIQDFLQHRTARVRLDGHTSHRVRLQQGVPQGGVISTTLFIVFIDDITDRLSRHISKALHADDLAIWNAEEHLTTATYRIQEALNIVAAWAKDWGVVINETKTVASIFSLSTQPEQAKLQLNGKHITLDDTPTYLGVRLDRRLTWNPQAQSMESKASRRLALMKKLAGTTWGAHSNILRRVYTGAVRPILEASGAQPQTYLAGIQFEVHMDKSKQDAPDDGASKTGGKRRKRKTKESSGETQKLTGEEEKKLFQRTIYKCDEERSSPGHDVIIQRETPLSDHATDKAQSDVMRKDQKRGDFDAIIISRQRGFIVIEVKAVGYDLKAHGDAASDQLHVLNSQDKFVFLTGPPGSGKTLVLGLKAVEWAREGDHVVIIRPQGLSKSGRHMYPCLSKSGRHLYPGLSKSGRHMYPCLSKSGRHLYPGLSKSGWHMYPCLSKSGRHLYPGLSKSGRHMYPGLSKSGRHLYPGLSKSGRHMYPGLSKSGRHLYPGLSKSGRHLYPCLSKSGRHLYPGLSKSGWHLWSDLTK
nr:hypothetical protein BaRGS_000573 [Batillaria attramentaria]